MSGDDQRFGDVGRNVIGSSVKGDKNILGENVQVVNNNIILSGKDVEKLIQEIILMNKDVSMQYGNTDDHKSSEQMERLKGEFEKLTGFVEELRSKGGESVDIYAGKLKISRTEMLLKRAILLKIEADQMLMDLLHSSTHETESGCSGEGGKHSNKSISGLDETEYEDKLKESLALLREVNKEEPTNVEVLLHMAQVVGTLEPDHPQKARRLIARAMGFLKNPKNDDEWFWKAEATFLMGTVGEETHPELLRDARKIFERLSRSEWVRQCDSLLEAFDSHEEGAVPEFQQINSTESSDLSIEFHPVGRWHIDVNDGSTIDVQFFQNGVVQGTQQNTINWQSFSFSGQWAYVPYSRLLQVQAVTNMGFPVMQVIGIQQKVGDTFLGFDMNGYQYRMKNV